MESIIASVPLRNIRPVIRSSGHPICRLQCYRLLSTSSALQSGHNRWSKIRHEKGAADAKKNILRSSFSKNITLYSKLYGANTGINPQLAAQVALAKKAGMPKAVIEAAIARGQGRSSDGAALQGMILEIMMPSSVAVIVEAETDNRARALEHLGGIVKRHSGNRTSTKFLFSRRGRVVFEKDATTGVDEIMDDAIEAGTEDLETDNEGNIVAWTQPVHTTQIAQTIGGKFGLQVLSAEIIWSPNEDTRASVGSLQELAKLTDMVAELQENPDVLAVYSNVEQGDADPEAWDRLVDNLDV